MAQTKTETKETIKKSPAKKVAKKVVEKSSFEVPVFDIKGKEKGTITLNESVWGLPWNADLVHQVATVMQGNQRSGTAHTKNRGEVRGGGKKPWKQKGTGNARHGSIRSPLWRGGGVTFGPRSDKDYSRKLNKKARRKALLTVLSQKLRDDEIIFVDSLSFDTPKTKEAVTFLASLAKGSKHIDLLTKKRNSALIGVPDRDEMFEKSFGNIGNMDVHEVRNINTLSLLTHKYLVLVNPDEAVKIFNQGQVKEVV